MPTNPTDDTSRWGRAVSEEEASVALDNIRRLAGHFIAYSDGVEAGLYFISRTAKWLEDSIWAGDTRAASSHGGNG